MGMASWQAMGVLVCKKFGCMLSGSRVCCWQFLKQTSQKPPPLTNLVHFAIKFGNLMQSLILWADDALILDTKKTKYKSSRVNIAVIMAQHAGGAEVMH